MMIFKKIIIIVFGLLLAAIIVIAAIVVNNRLSVVNNNSDSCFILDQTYKIHEFSKNGQIYYVYSSIIGMQDKTYTYHLFDKEPKVSECGLFVDQDLLSVDIPRGKSAKKLIIKPDEIEVIFKTPQELESDRSDDSPPDTPPMGNVKIEVVDVPRETK